MPTKKELKENIWLIWKILTLAKECYQYSYYMHKPETPGELEYLKYSQHFQFIRHILWRNTVIELCKLFSKSSGRDKFNIFHFIGKLKKDGHFRSFDVDATKITDWESRLDANKETIEKLLILRDKVYAHTDRMNKNPDDLTPTFEAVKQLIDIVENVIQEIYATVFETHAMMETPLFNRNRFDIVKVLADAKNTRLQPLLDEIKQRKRE